MTLANAQPPSATVQINDSIRTFVFEQYPLCKQRELQDTDSLIESGIVDSMGILELVAFIESEFDIQVEDIDLTPENFESIEAIATFVTAKRTAKR